MSTVGIRKKLHEYIADADDKKVKRIYLLLEDEIAKREDFNCAPKHLEMLEEEKRNHISGTSKSYSWEEAKEIIRGNKTMD
jgi:hypothetical protein